MQFRHDLDAILDVSVETLPESLQWEHFFAYMVANGMVMAAQRIAGRSDDAEATARRIVEAQSEFARLFDPDAFLPGARLSASAIFDEQGNLVDDYEPASHVALSQLDLDKAVELILAQKARHASWYGTDMIAAFNMWARNVVTHPDMQRFYVEEGKWVDYLAADVPEYAQYRQ